MTHDHGIKKRVELALMAAMAEPPMSMGDIMRKASIPKTNASDVSSALHKLRGDGLIKAVRGPSSSAKGPKFVRLYQWVVRPAKRAVEPAVSPMSNLGMFRC